MFPALETAITNAGGLSQLARKLKKKPNVVNNWRTRGVPPKECRGVARYGNVEVHDLRPDVFGPPPRKRAGS